MIEKRRKVRLLFSSMRRLGKESPLVSALRGLEKNDDIAVTVVVAQASQQAVITECFPTADFQVRGLGNWPEPSDRVFSAEVLSLFSTTANSAGFLDFKRQVVASLNRHDSSGTFRMIDREMYFQESLLAILSLLVRNRVTHLFFDITPHVSRDYMLYWVGKTLGLKVLFFQPVPWAGISVPKSDITGSVAVTPAMWSPASFPPVSDFFSHSLGQGRVLVDNLKQSNAGWVAKYQAPEIKKLDARSPSFFKNVASVRRKMAARNSVNFSGLGGGRFADQLLAVFIEWRLRKDFLKVRTIINSLAFKPPRDYVLFALTHEPERTFFPEALPHQSQFEVALEIAANLKPGFKLLVKEHETQFVPGRRGYASRSLHFYRVLQQVANIQVVPSAASAKSLVHGASAVVSATGTICLEAALQGKPSYHFGHPWWAGFPGTKRLERFDGIVMDGWEVPGEIDIEQWVSHFINTCVPTTANVDSAEFSQKFAALPEYFPKLEERSIRMTLQDFIDEPEE